MEYQEFNRSWKKWGRITELSVVGPHLKLKFESESCQVLYQEAYDSLKVFDWIAIDEHNKIVRIVPSLAKLLTTLAKKENLKKWSQFLKTVRHFFDSQDFLEIQTPTLVASPGTEPTLEAFSTDLKTGSQLKKVFLPTSPELHLKKALTLGFDKIYEIAKCYRNNEITPIHQPEFLMLEWYRSFANLFDLQADMVRLVNTLCDQFQHPRPSIQALTIRQLFKAHLNFELTPDCSVEDLRNLCLHHSLRVNDSFTIDDLFFILMLEKIEPQLPKDCLVFVEKYPPFQAALARKDHEGWAERFEVYWKGMEIANAFDELNNPHEQRSRAEQDLQKREGRSAINLDEEFFQSLESGMPPSAGIALGVERLFMALLNLKTIEEIRLFPIKPS